MRQSVPLQALLDALKRLLVSLLPIFCNIPPQKLVHVPGNRGSMLQESVVERQKLQERLEAFLGGRWRCLHDGTNFLPGRVDLYFTRLVVQKADFRDAKLALHTAQSQVRGSRTLQHHILLPARSSIVTPLTTMSKWTQVLGDSDGVVFMSR